MNVMLDEGGIRTAVEQAPNCCEPVLWGKRLPAVGVDLHRVDHEPGSRYRCLACARFPI